ncbi:MAG: peptidylprolyl isomerase, partial [Pseudomonadota bacterium]
MNDTAITPYEIEQRARLLRTLGAARNADSEARDVLIEERLQVAAANDLGITATEADVADALDELAARGNL